MTFPADFLDSLQHLEAETGPMPTLYHTADWWPSIDAILKVTDHVDMDCIDTEMTYIGKVLCFNKIPGSYGECSYLSRKGEPMQELDLDFLEALRLLRVAVRTSALFRRT